MREEYIPYLRRFFSETYPVDMICDGEVDFLIIIAYMAKMYDISKEIQEILVRSKISSWGLGSWDSHMMAYQAL